MARLLTGQDSQRFDDWSARWAIKNMDADLRKNLIPPFPFSLASMSTDHVVEALAKHWGADGALSSRFERVDGRFTGRLASPQCGGQGKADMIREDCHRRGLTLAEVGLLTDHHRDIPALEIVGYPLLVNMSDELSQWNDNKNYPVLDVNNPVDWEALQQ